MLAGKLRVLSAGDPDPYPDSIHISFEDGNEDAADEGCTITKAKRRTKKTAIQKAVERLTARR